MEFRRSIFVIYGWQALVASAACILILVLAVDSLGDGNGQLALLFGGFSLFFFIATMQLAYLLISSYEHLLSRETLKLNLSTDWEHIATREGGLFSPGYKRKELEAHARKLLGFDGQFIYRGLTQFSPCLHMRARQLYIAEEGIVLFEIRGRSLYTRVIRYNELAVARLCSGRWVKWLYLRLSLANGEQYVLSIGFISRVLNSRGAGVLWPLPAGEQKALQNFLDRKIFKAMNPELYRAAA